MFISVLVARKSMALGILSIAILMLGSVAQAQTARPFKISGGGFAPNGLNPTVGSVSSHNATGEATHLGRYQGAGALILNTLDLETLSGTFGSAEPFVFQAANGDKLVTQYGNTGFGAKTPGTYQIIPLGNSLAEPVVVVFLAEFVVQPNESTGRFKGATGSWIMEARTAPFILGSTTPLPYMWQGQGKISMPRR